MDVSKFASRRDTVPRVLKTEVNGCKVVITKREVMSRLIEKLDDEEKLLPSDDGYCVYWADGGYMTAEHLREIADELDRRNKRWHEQVTQDVGPPMSDAVCSDFQPDWTMPISEYARIQKESMPKIKPLVWEEGTKLIEEWVGVCALGKFRIFRKLQCEPVTIYMAPFLWQESPSDLQTIDEAKAACEQEYERRVRECLP